MSRKIPSAIALLITLALAAFNSQAQLYKWVDENGEIHYSDKEPGEEIDSKVLPQRQTSGGQSRQTATSSSKPIIRPYEKTARKLHLLDTRYLWKSEAYVNQTTKIGVFHTGKGCTSRGAMNTPDIFVYHKSLFPSESDLTYRINKIINGLDYDSERTEKYRLLGRLKKTGGLSLHTEIIAMDINSCAPGIRQSERLKKMDRISSHRFSKNRIKLQVAWQLRNNRDQDVIYEVTTAGNYNGWSQSTSSKNAIGNALESAVLALFSDRDFIAWILVEGDGAEPDAAPPSVTNRYLLQAHAAQVFSEITVVKIGALEHFMMEGDWPDSLPAIGIPDSIFNNSEAIAHVNLQPDGSIVVELTELFGSDKIITLSPEANDGNMGLNRWHCSSNLDSSYLPQSCEGL